MRARPRDEEEAAVSTDPTTPDPGDEPTGARAPGDPGVTDDGTDGPARRRGPAVPILAVLLVLLLAAAGFLWFTRPSGSAVRTGDYAEALQAARSGIKDYTSFDYLTLDDDIEQIRRVAVGDLRDEGVARLDERRAEITAAKAVSNTEIIDAGVTRANGEDATVLLVIQSTQQSTASPQAQIVRYRIEVSLEKDGERWMLSGIKGTEGPGDD
jgi:Mce-associated membrane protein